MKKSMILMTIALFAVIAGCQLFLEDCMPDKGKVEYNHEKTYTTTTNNCIGACTDTSIRSGFDCAASGATYDDTNTRF